ncbi:MAG: hypothetical protein HYY77_19325 [Betaproteobacteria bacterium]|nr:hypothetical protein [Betaproteobacteria bacterium]
MESDGDSLILEPDVTAPRRSKPAALKVRSSVKSGAEAGADQALLVRLLAMAHRYRSEGKLGQAVELYWKLAEDYAGTPQADAARAMLLELATSYERDGARHMARSIYERLLDVRG